MIRRVVMPIFESSVYMITTQDEARVFISEHCENPDNENWSDFLGFAHEITDSDGKTRHVLAVFDGSVNTAIHEATHMAQTKMKHLGLKLRVVNDETLAYFTAWLAEAMMSLLAEESILNGDESPVKPL